MSEVNRKMMTAFRVVYHEGIDVAVFSRGAQSWPNYSEQDQQSVELALAQEVFMVAF